MNTKLKSFKSLMQDYMDNKADMGNEETTFKEGVEFTLNYLKEHSSNYYQSDDGTGVDFDYVCLDLIEELLEELYKK